MPPKATAFGGIEPVKKYYFLTKGFAACLQRTRHPLLADGAHVCRPRSIFFAAHVAEENDWAFFAPAGANSTRFWDKLNAPESRWLSGAFLYADQKSAFPTVRGCSSTSRMLLTPVRYMTMRSKPRPKPA